MRQFVLLAYSWDTHTHTRCRSFGKANLCGQNGRPLSFRTTSRPKGLVNVNCPPQYSPFATALYQRCCFSLLCIRLRWTVSNLSTLVSELRLLLMCYDKLACVKGTENETLIKETSAGSNMVDRCSSARSKWSIIIPTSINSAAVVKFLEQSPVIRQPLR